jgi:hypothetical protein
MITAHQRPVSVLFLFVALAASGIIVYFQVAREMNYILIGVIGIVVFFICFFNVRISLSLLIVSMLLSPEIMIGETTKREITIRFEDILLFIMTIGWLIRIAIYKDIGFMLKNPLNLPIVFYSAAAIVSTLLGSIYGHVSPLSGFFFVLKIIEYFFLFSIIVNFVREEQEVNQLLTLMLIVGGIICIYGLFQVMIGGDISAPFEGEQGEKNTLGGYLVLLGAVVTGILMHTDSHNERNLLIVLLVMLVPLLLFSLSRGSWFSSIVTAVALFFVTKQKNVYIIILLLFIIIFPLIVPGPVQERFAYTYSQRIEPGQITIGSLRLDTSTSARLLSYIRVLKNMYRHLFFGFGVTGFSFVDGQFFRTLSEMGIIGLTLLIWMLVRLHNLIRKAMKIGHSPRLQGMAIGFYAAFWGMIAHAMSANTLIIVRIAEPFWCLAGLTIIYLLHGEWKHQEEMESGESFIGRKLPYNFPAGSNSLRLEHRMNARKGKQPHPVKHKE